VTAELPPSSDRPVSATPAPAPTSAAAAPAGGTGTATAALPLRWQQRLALWWAEFSLQTKLLAVATLVVSLMMTSITFIALNGIQRDARMSDTRFARDLGLLLAANVTPLVAEANDRELAALKPQPALHLLRRSRWGDLPRHPDRWQQRQQ
jgi:two-component system, OmpR family, sensor histidine kinase NblS